MEVQNPPPDFVSVDENLGGSVNGESFVLSEIPGTIENPEIKTTEIENPCLNFPKSQELQEVGKLDDTQIIKILDESVEVETLPLKILNSSSDFVQSDKSVSGSLKIEDGECSETLEDLRDTQIGGENLGDAQLSKTLDESNDVEGNDDDTLNDCSPGDYNGSGGFDFEKDHKLERAVVPYNSNPSNFGCRRCEEEEEEGNWRNIPRHGSRSRVSHSRPHYCEDCGCERRHNHPWHSDKDRFYGNPNRFDPEPCPVGAGLANLGNTCFLNAIMQCFTHTVVLVEGLLSLKHEASSHGVGEFCVLCAVRDHIECSFVKSGRVIAPSNLVDNLSNISSFFRRYQQEDAHEFLQALLDKLDSNWSKYEATANDAICSSSPSDTLVQQIFGGRFVSQIRCCKCGHSSDTPDPLLDLSLEIGEVDNLESALKSFTKVEILEDTEKFFCDNCQELVKAEKQLMLDHAPSVAALHLKRFKNDGICIEKIDKMVEYPLELDFAPYTKGSDDANEDLKYELYAVVVHVGFAATSGHYYCYIRTSPEEWYRFDDSKVTRVSEDIALRQDAYILFYTKKGTPWFSTLFDKWKEECCEKISSTSPKSVLHDMDLPSTSNSVGPSIHSCDPICKSSTAPLSELRLQDEVETKADVGTDLHGSSQRDGSRDASTVPASEPMQDTVEPMTGVEAWDSSVANPTSTTLSVPSRNYEVTDEDTELDDTQFVMEVIGANKGKTCSKTIGILGTPHIDDIFDCGLETDIGMEPSTPVRDPSPTKFSDREPAGAYEIPRNHLKTKHKSSSSAPPKKSSINTREEDMKRKEAAKLCKSMPRGRGSFFMNFVDPSSSSKKRKQASIFHNRESPKKRVKTSPKRVLQPSIA